MKGSALLLCIAIGTSIAAQKTYNGLPVINAGSNKADYRMDTTWVKGGWNIAPEASPDVLEIPTFSRNVQFSFFTDKDSISFPVNAVSKKQFYVLTSDQQYALTEIRGFDYEPIQFDPTANGKAIKFWYEGQYSNPFLVSLKEQYPIEAAINREKWDSAKALRIMKWVHDQWKHSGNNQPQKSDALSILAEAKQGKRFRCVEYGIVATAALNAIGLPARVLGLKTKDVETTASGAGHVLLEVYLNDLNKWVLLDPQFDVMPVLRGMPLNAVEFQQAIATDYDGLQLRSLSGTSKNAYVKWVFPYLYYFDVAFDNRENPHGKKKEVEGASHLMLVPKGAKNPTIFQKKWPITKVIYTNSLSQFYAAPAR